jgi:hypothetical protein
MLMRKAQVALKLESTEGTAITLAAADADMFVYDVSFSPDIQVTPRNPLRATLSNLPHFIGRKQASISFKTELAGSGTAGTAPVFGDALVACGMGETVVASTSVTYLPDSDGTEGDGTSASVAVFIDGKKYLIYGARGDYEMGFVAGEPAFITFTFTGLYGGVTDLALLSGISYPTVVPAVWLGVTLTKGGAALVAENLTLAMNNTVSMRTDVTQSSGFVAAAITARDPGGNFDPEETTVAARDDWGQMAAGTATVFAATLGSAAGNILTIGAPELVIESISHGDRDGVLTNGIDFKLQSDTAAGEDELSLAFT